MDKDSIERAYRNWLTRGVYIGMRIVVAVAAVVYAVQGDWSDALATALVFLLMFVPMIMRRRFHVYLPFALELGIVAFIFLSLFFGDIQNYYDSLPAWDKLLHFQSGLILAVAGFVVVYLLNETDRGLDLSSLFVAVFAAFFAIALGALWEIGEFTGDVLFLGHWQPSLEDTMWDLIADSIGAILVSAIGYVWMRYESRIPFTPRFLRMIEEEKASDLL